MKGRVDRYERVLRRETKVCREEKVLEEEEEEMCGGMEEKGGR